LSATAILEERRSGLAGAKRCQSAAGKTENVKLFFRAIFAHLLTKVRACFVWNNFITYTATPDKEE
jgi:hypothetical protein